MRTVTPAEVQDVLRRMERTDVRRVDAELAHQIAVRDGISAYVTGEVAAAGSAYMVSARLIATESGEVLVALRENADDDDDLIEAVDRLSTTLRERTGESLRTIRRAEPLAKVTTSSLEALQYYTQGGRAALWEGNPGRAIELHEEAVRLDTAFAAAHRALAVHYFNRGNANRSIESAERALRFSDRMTEIERASSAATLHLARSEFSQAAGALERVIAIDPENASALNNLGLVYDAMKDLARGEEYYRRSVQADTGRFFGYANLGEHLVLSGRYAEAEQAYADAALRAPQSAWPVVALAQVPYSAGDIVEAEARLQRLIDDAASTRGIQERANDRLVHLHRIAGRYADAKRRTRAQMAAAPDSRDDAFFAMDRVHEELFVYRRPDAARRELAAMRTAMSELEAGGGYLNCTRS
jgi:tetratricopeptide (TPR) repeat protein